MTRGHASIPGAALMMIVGAVAFFSASDAMIKWLAQRHPVPLLVWARWAAQVLAMLVWLAPSMGMGMVRTGQLRMQLVRGCLLIGSSAAFIAALKLMPLADATALNYTTPTIVIVLAVLFLHERFTPARAVFVVAGLLGMLMIVKPGADLFRAAALFPLISAGCYSLYQITTRMLRGEDPRVTLFYPALVGTAIMTLIWPWFGVSSDVSAFDVALMLAVGISGTIGHFLFILAFQRAAASALTPFTYLQLVFATLVGWFVFGDLPDGLTFAGMSLIAGSGFLLTWYERRRALIVPPEPTAVE